MASFRNGSGPLLIWLVAGMAVLGVLAVIFVTWLRPTADNTVLITTILGFIGTITAALATLVKSQEALTAASESKKLGEANTELLGVIRNDVNGKMQKLLDATGKAERAEGMAEGREEGKGEAEDKKIEIKEIIVATVAEVKKEEDK